MAAQDLRRRVRGHRRCRPSTAVRAAPSPRPSALPAGGGAVRDRHRRLLRRPRHGRADAPRARHRGAEAASTSRRCCAATTVWCQLFSEPGAGSDLAGLTTRAVRDGDEWVVDGQKVWNCFAHIADWGILLARTDWDVPEAPRHHVLPRRHDDARRRGAAAAPDHRRRALQRDVPHGRAHPAENVLGEVNGGWGVTQTTLMAERMLIGGGGMGLGFRDYVALARTSAHDDDPVIRQRLARGVHALRDPELARRARAGRGEDGQPDGARELGDEAGDLRARRAERRPRARDRRAPTGCSTAPTRSRTASGSRCSSASGASASAAAPSRCSATSSASACSASPPKPRPDKTEPFREVPKNT